MKKALFSILTAIAAVWMITVGALAAQPGVAGEYACGRGRNCADVDRDGICDNCGRKSLHCISQTVLESLRSISKTVMERCYVDADGDGVCDNYNGCWGNGEAGTGQGGGFVDTDNDGICDNYGGCHGTSAGGNGQGCRGRGHGNGHHGRHCR